LAIIVLCMPTSMAEEFHVAWNTRLPARIYATSAVHEGAIYTAVDGPGLYSLNTEDGSPVWTWQGEHDGEPPEVRAPLTSVPTAAGGSVLYVDECGTLQCIARDAGTTRWACRLAGEYGIEGFEVDTVGRLEGGRPGLPVRCLSPVVSGSNVIVQVQGRDTAVVALDIASGDEVWRTGPLGRGGYAAPALLDLGGREQIVCLFHKQSAGLDPETGEVLWTFPLYSGAYVFASAVPLAPSRYVVFYGGLAPEVFEIGGDGRARLSEVLPVHVGTLDRPVPIGDTFYLISPHSYHGDSGLFALTRPELEPVWLEKGFGENGASMAAPLGERLVVCSSRGAVRLYTPAARESVPDGLFYLSSNYLKGEPDGSFLVLDAECVLPNEKVVLPLHVWKGIIIVCGQSTVYALEVR
jgi:outer membrane protein assembly factor BamB